MFEQSTGVPVTLTGHREETKFGTFSECNLMAECLATGDHGHAEDLRFPCCLRSAYLPDVQL